MLSTIFVRFKTWFLFRFYCLSWQEFDLISGFTVQYNNGTTLWTPQRGNGEYEFKKACLKKRYWNKEPDFVVDGCWAYQTVLKLNGCSNVHNLISLRTQWWKDPPIPLQEWSFLTQKISVSAFYQQNLCLIILLVKYIQQEWTAKNDYNENLFNKLFFKEMLKELRVAVKP